MPVLMDGSQVYYSLLQIFHKIYNDFVLLGNIMLQNAHSIFCHNVYYKLLILYNMALCLSQNAYNSDILHVTVCL